MSRLRDKPFSALKAHWYKKLAASGFKDAEDSFGRFKEPAPFSSSRHAQSDVVFCESKAEYFRSAGLFLHSHQFINALERNIWRFHAEGQTVREIADFYTRRNRPMSRMKVQATIERLRLKMKGL